MAADAEKLFQAMIRTKTGWKASDFETLYTGFGFEKVETSNDTKYRRNDLNLFAYVSRSSKELAPGYASTAVRTIRRLKQLKEETENG